MDRSEKTIYSIAAAAGVSPATVSRALSGKGYVSAATKEKILAEAGSFSPRKAGVEVLSRNSSKTIGVIVSQNFEYFFQNNIYSDIMQGISEILTPRDYTFLLDFRHVDSASIIELYTSGKVDGFILIGISSTSSLLDDLSSSGIPAVLIGDRIDHKGKATCAHVDIDDFAAAKDITDFLITLGHRKIAFISYSYHYASSYNRFLGYKTALSEAGLTLDPRYVVQLDNMTEEKAINLTKHLLYQSEVPTAIIAFNSIITIAVYKALEDCGYSIPNDISVVGFDDSIFSRYASPPVTTVWQPSVEKGRVAADILLKALDNNTLPDKIVTLPSMIIYRNSYAVPRLLEKKPSSM